MTRKTTTETTMAAITRAGLALLLLRPSPEGGAGGRGVPFGRGVGTLGVGGGGEEGVCDKLACVGRVVAWFRGEVGVVGSGGDGVVGGMTRGGILPLVAEYGDEIEREMNGWLDADTPMRGNRVAETGRDLKSVSNRLVGDGVGVVRHGLMDEADSHEAEIDGVSEDDISVGADFSKGEDGGRSRNAEIAVKGVVVAIVPLRNDVHVEVR